MEEFKLTLIEDVLTDLGIVLLTNNFTLETTIEHKSKHDIVDYFRDLIKEEYCKYLSLGVIRAVGRVNSVRCICEETNEVIEDNRVVTDLILSLKGLCYKINLERMIKQYNIPTEVDISELEDYIEIHFTYKR